MKATPLLPWFNEYVIPMVDAYWVGDIWRARTAHATALASLDAETDPDYRKAKWMRLATPWLTVLVEHGVQGEAQQVLAELVVAWSGEQPGPESRELACVTELMTRLHLDWREWQLLYKEEARTLIAAVPENFRGGNFWSAVGHWAFKNGERELLELALGHFATDPPQKLREWQYYSIRLMYRLLERIALGEDLERVASLVAGAPQLRELECCILPECAHQGIVTAKAEQTLREKSELFAA